MNGGRMLVIPDEFAGFGDALLSRPATAVMSYRPLGDDREATAVGELLSKAFAFPAAEAVPWLEKSGRHNVRVLREGRRAVACLLLLPMGQWFGGRAVPMTGIAAVGVAPERRGRGAAAAIMTAMLRELHAQGQPLSALYPATQVLYRKVGYEQAGGRWAVEAPVSALVVRGRRAPGQLRTLVDADNAAVNRCYQEVAARGSGWLDRGEYVWDRVRHPRGETTFGYGLGGDVIDGYLYFHQKRATGGRYDLVLSDFCARTPRAAESLLGFLAAHRSMAESVRLWAASPPPALIALPEQSYRVRLDHHWMLRIVDVRKALALRGYPLGLRAEVHLAIRDEVIRANAGRWVLSIDDGHARVRRGGRGDLALHIRTLAPLYTGHLAPLELRALGLLQADPTRAAAASPVFAGPPPGTADMF